MVQTSPIKVLMLKKEDKKMKKQVLFGTLMFALLTVTGCSSEDATENNSGKQITITAGIEGSADSRLTYTDDNSKSMSVSWSDQESFTMYNGANDTGKPFTKNVAGNIFSGTPPEGTGTYYGVYGTDITNASGVLTIDLSAAQTGTSSAENGIKEFMLAEASDLKSKLQFNHKLCVLKLKLTLPKEETATKVDKVSISGMHNKATYSLADGYTKNSYEDTNKGIISATNNNSGFDLDNNHQITAYVAVFPETVVANQVTIIATVGSVNYAYTLSSERTLTAGKVTLVTVTLVKIKTYTAADFKSWGAENRESAPSKDDIKKYLGAGVYWDNGANGVGKQTYIVNGTPHHAGLWLMKMNYIEQKGPDVNPTNSATPTSGRPADIENYFFLPAAGCYYNGYFYNAGSFGYYWSSTPHVGDFAYYLGFCDGDADVYFGDRDSGYLPLVAE